MQFEMMQSEWLFSDAQMIVTIIIVQLDSINEGLRYADAISFRFDKFGNFSNWFQL